MATFQVPPPIELKPIDTAPISPGHEFGPCVLMPGYNCALSVGRFNGRDWGTLGGFPLLPLFWGIIPAL